MDKLKKTYSVLVLLICTLIFPAEASALDDDFWESQLKNSGAQELVEHLPDETADYLADIGVSPDNGVLSADGAFEVIEDIFTDSSGELSGILASCVGTVIACAVITCAADCVQSKTVGKVISCAASAAMCVSIALPAAEYMTSACGAVLSCCVFDEAFVPVYAAIAAISGRPASSTAYSGAVLTVVGASAAVVGEYVLPVLRCILAITFVSSLQPSPRISGLMQLLEHYLKWTLGLIAVIAVGITGVSTASAAAMDTLTGKTAKYVISGSVPVLGGVMNDALASAAGSIGVLRTSVGGFGLIAMSFILLPPLIKGMMWRLCLGACSLLAETLGVGGIRELCSSVESILSIIIAIIIFTAIITVFTLSAIPSGGM